MSGLLGGKRNRVRVVGSVSVGCTPKRLKEEVQKMIFKFHDFENLTHRRGKKVESPSIRAFGHEWYLKLYPLGNKNSSERTDYISCSLQYDGDDTVFVKCSFRCMDKCKIHPKIVPFGDDDCNNELGFNNYLKREDVLENYLNEDGTLVIEVDMQIAVDKEENDDVWYPKLNIPNDVLTQIYHSSFENDTNTSDAVFDVDGKEFHGHKSVLSVRSPTLFELMKDNSNNNTNKDGVVVPIPIPNMESDIFERVLKFIYCVEIPTIEDAATGTKLLHAANRFGIVDLKMYIESTIVEKFLDSSNAAYWLVFSDSHSCPLLKEATLKLYDTDDTAVMESEGWSHIEESPRLLVGILKFCKMKQKASSAISNNENAINDVTKLDVTSLRERLLEAHLDIDGNQEILMERLKDHISSPSSTSNSTRTNNASSPAAAAVAAIPQRQLRPDFQRQLRSRRQPRR
mmetsp:Transcript_10561/g.10204  ORF Transcript_10561/g.10204 Transcript_10561/m.10204 type:complete len:457 (+) Transcript_10561:58-1428(+)